LVFAAIISLNLNALPVRDKNSHENRAAMSINPPYDKPSHCKSIKLMSNSSIKSARSRNRRLDSRVSLGPSDRIRLVQVIRTGWWVALLAANSNIRFGFQPWNTRSFQDEDAMISVQRGKPICDHETVSTATCISPRKTYLQREKLLWQKFIYLIL